jgi:glutamyl-tRNA synthetase
MESTPVRGRYAPSPTGLLHVGNARTALAAWWSVRRAEGTFVMRIEDLDPPRVVDGADAAALDDLRWLGLDWDEGPDVGGPYGPYRQSQRGDWYDGALARLAEFGYLFPCHLSRRELREIGSAPHPGGEQPYPRGLRPTDLPVDWFAAFQHSPGAALRFRVEPGIVRASDRVLGIIEQDVAMITGDFVLKRRDGLFAYQLAVVVDDIAMAIDEVVRGADILDSTGRQILLTRALGATPPRHAHVPLVLNARGDKLSKRDEALTIRSVRDAGVHPEQLVGYLAWSLGILPEPAAATAEEMIATFTWERVTREPFVLPDALDTVLRRL